MTFKGPITAAILAAALMVSPAMTSPLWAADYSQLPGAQLSVKANAGDAEAQYQLGYNLYHDKTHPDMTQARSWFEKAAAQGHAKAAYAAGLMYSNGDGGDADQARAVVYFRQAAKGDVAPANAAMGVAYATGAGVETDLDQMLAWYKKGAALGDAKSERMLGQATLYGIGTESDPAAAVAWLRKSAAQNDAEAEATLAGIYYDGDGVTADYTEAYKWAALAAKHGSADGNYYTGLMEENGRGTKQDYNAAFISYGAAYQEAHGGRALTRIGVMLCNGHGVAKDPESGLKALHAAATPATPEAFFAMGDLYTTGQCVAKDVPRAFVWKRLGILFRDRDVTPWPDELKTLSDQMTAAQKAGIPALTQSVAAEVGMDVDVNDSKP